MAFFRMVTKSKLYSSTGNQAALLIHGGCFTEGDETWNADQAQSIADECDLDVYTLNFSKSSLASSIHDMKEFFMQLYSRYQGQVGLIGCSSGGFLVLNLLKEIDIPQFVVLICPVMDPEKREEMLLAKEDSDYNRNIQRQQLTYFRQKPYPKADLTNCHLTIIAAKDDENVPLALIEGESARYPNLDLHIIDGSHKISYTNSFSVNEIIANKIKNCLEVNAHKTRVKFMVTRLTSH